MLPPEALTSHIVPSLTPNSLISNGQLCDSGCTATLNADTTNISFQGETILTGHRNPLNRLWEVNRSTPCANANLVPSRLPILAASQQPCPGPSLLSILAASHRQGQEPRVPSLLPTLAASHQQAISNAQSQACCPA
jgi:hypothetical protein